MPTRVDGRVWRWTSFRLECAAATEEKQKLMKKCLDYESDRAFYAHYSETFGRLVQAEKHNHRMIQIKKRDISSEIDQNSLDKEEHRKEGLITGSIRRGTS